MNEPLISPQKPVGLIARVQSLLLNPTPTWEAIATEAASVKGLYTGYVMILAAIPAVIGFLSSLLFATVLSFAFSGMAAASLVLVVVSSLVGYVLTLVSVWVMSLIIDGFAPSFGAQKNPIQAFKVAAYSGTAMYVSAIALIIPFLGGLVVLAGAIYSVYLLYLGLKKVMSAPEDKAVGYTAVVVIIMLVAGFVCSLVVGTITSAGIVGGALLANRNAAVTGDVTVPGVGSVNLGKLEDASKQMESAASAMSTGEGVKAADAQALQALLPPSLEGAPPLNVESGSGGAMGMNASSAKATYAAGEGSITLTVADIGGAGAFAAMGAAFNVNSSKQNAEGYEKITSKDGLMETEEYNNTTRSGKYSVIVNARLMIEAEGEKVGMDKLKAAVNSIDRTKALALMK